MDRSCACRAVDCAAVSVYQGRVRIITFNMKQKKRICLAALYLVGAPASCRDRNFAIFCAYYRLNVKFFNKSYLICKIVNFVKFTIELCHHLLIVFSTVYVLLSKEWKSFINLFA